MNFEDLWLECRGNYGIQQKKEEFQEFIELIRSKNVDRVLEIGCYSGGTTRGFLDVANKVISIDGTKQPQIDSLSRDFPGRHEFFLMNSHAEETVNTIRDLLHGEKVDLLFIDGDHSAQGSMQDFELYKEFVKTGGIIAFHDIVNSEHHHMQGCYVDETWAILKEKYNGTDIILVDNVWAGIGYLIND